MSIESIMISLKILAKKRWDCSLGNDEECKSTSITAK
jgi:hypothetical protein